MPYLFRLSFPNRASDSGDLYIDFNRNQPLFPVALLDFHVEDRFNHFFPNHAYALHIASHMSCIVLHHVACASHVVDCVMFACCLVVLVWVEPGDEFMNEEPIEFAYEDQVNSDNFAGKMIIPSKSLISLLARCSLFCYAYDAIPTTCLSYLPYC